MPYLIQRRVRTSQPQQAVGAPGNYKLLLSANQQKNTLLQAVGTPSLVPAASGLGFSFGSGNYFQQQGLVLSGLGAGEELQYNNVIHISFVVTDNSSTDALASIGTSPTDGGPSFILQNNSGTIRVFDGVAYNNLGAAVIGKLQTVTITYSDANPYPNKYYLDGQLVASVNRYRLAYNSKYFYIGSGFPAQTINATLLQVLVDQPGNWTDDEIFAYANNIYSIFEDEEDYIWVPDVGGGYTATGAVPGSGSIVTGAATKTQVYSGSGAVAGTGATVTGAATRSFDSTGTVAGSGAIVTGSATNTQPSITSTGVVTGQGAIVSGAATRQFSSTGTVAGQGATVTGAATKTQVYSSTGAVVGGGAVVAGTATNTPLGISAYGDVAGQGSIVSGVATRAFSSTGAVVGAVATVAGTATRAFTATGAIAGYTAVITGAATNTPLGINGYGSVSGQGASVSGTATVTAVFTSTGAVVGSDATITGSATNVRVVTSSGAISGQGATVAGAAIVSGITVWPLASDVRRGIVYGPSGNDYTGTLSVGTGSGGGMNVILSEPRLSVVSRDNSVYVIQETQRKIFS